MRPGGPRKAPRTPVGGGKPSRMPHRLAGRNAGRGRPPGTAGSGRGASTPRPARPTRPRGPGAYATRPQGFSLLPSCRLQARWTRTCPGVPRPAELWVQRAVASEAGHGPVSSLEPENLGAKGEAAVFLFTESDFAKNGPNGSFVSLHVHQAQLGVPRPAFPRPQGAPLIHKDPPPGQAGH